MDKNATVFVVDDDEAVRDSLRWLIESVGLKVKCFATGKEFLEGFDAESPGCLLLDVRMPGMSGLELQEKLASARHRLPVIVITGHADVAMAVRALKAGAVDFVEKPFNDQVLLDCVQRAILLDTRTRRATRELAQISACVAALTRRERQVMDLVVAGKSNRLIAEELGLSEKTIEVHRARVMSKMKAQSLVDLVRMSMVYGSPAAEG